MSATNRGSERHANDFYETPRWCTEAILPHLYACRSAGFELPIVIDAGCGTGAIGACFARGIQVVGVDVVPRKLTRGYFVQQDFLVFDPGEYVDLVISNPPYKLAMEFVKHALSLNTKEVAMLLRLNWQGGQGRAEFHRAYPSDVYVLPRRPSFTGDGKTDATEYAWFVWGEGRGGRWQVLKT